MPDYRIAGAEGGLIGELPEEYLSVEEEGGYSVR